MSPNVSVFAALALLVSTLSGGTHANSRRAEGTEVLRKPIEMTTAREFRDYLRTDTKWNEHLKKYMRLEVADTERRENTLSAVAERNFIHLTNAQLEDGFPRAAAKYVNSDFVAHGIIPARDSIFLVVQRNAQHETLVYRVHLSDIGISVKRVGHLEVCHRYAQDPSTEGTAGWKMRAECTEPAAQTTESRAQTSGPSAQTSEARAQDPFSSGHWGVVPYQIGPPIWMACAQGCCTLDQP